MKLILILILKGHYFWEYRFDALLENVPVNFIAIFTVKNRGTVYFLVM